MPFLGIFFNFMCKINSPHSDLTVYANNNQKSLVNETDLRIVRLFNSKFVTDSLQILYNSISFFKGKTVSVVTVAFSTIFNCLSFPFNRNKPREDRHLALGLSSAAYQAGGTYFHRFLNRPEVYRPLFQSNQKALVEGKKSISLNELFAHKWQEIQQFEMERHAVWTKEGFRSFGEPYSVIPLSQFNSEGRFPLGENDGYYVDILSRSFGEHPHNSIRLHKVKNGTVTSHSFGFYPEKRATSLWGFCLLAIKGRQPIMASPDPMDFVLSKSEDFSLTRLEANSHSYQKVLDFVLEGNFLDYHLLFNNCKHFAQSVVREVTGKQSPSLAVLPGQFGSWLADEFPNSTTCDKNQMHL